MQNYAIQILMSNKDIKIGDIIIKLDGIEKVINSGIKIIFTILLMYISIKIGNFLIKKFVEKQCSSKAIISLESQRAKTLGEVMKSVLRYMVYFIGTTAILSYIFSGVSFTFASIGGLAVGFGAQSFVKDLINGFFILFEDQFGVGDYVTIGNYNGIVKSIGIRTTVIDDFSGDVHSIPNGSIVEVTNHSRNDIRFIVDIDIAYEEDIDDAIALIKNICREFQKNNEDVISKPIEVLGVIALAESGVTIRITGKAKPLKQWEMERELRKTIKNMLDKENIEIPYSKIQIINADIEKGEKA